MPAMRNTYCIALFAVLVVLVLDAYAEVLNVPEQYPTIQAALDSSAAFDTVSVAPGVYHEFLIAPAHVLMLTGWHPGDTLSEFRTTLDPIPTGIDTPSAAVFNGDSVAIRNFAFYNQPEYRQYGNATRTGGIHLNRYALSIENCRFDSVSRAIKGGSRLYLRNCTFDGCLRQCVFPSVLGRVDCENCAFDGEGTWLLNCYSGSSIRNSSFLCNRLRAEFLTFAGSNITISGCRFGPCFSAFPIIGASPFENCVIESCVFEGIDRASSLIAVYAECSEPFERTPLTIRGNIFMDYHGIDPAAGTTAISVICQEIGSQRTVDIYSNVFADGSSNIGAGVWSDGAINVNRNVFENLLPDTLADVLISGIFTDTVHARNNSFLAPGIAASTSGPPFDARGNWWGDSTGPYNGFENPNGQGTEVGNGVEFIPWLTSPPDSLPDTTGTGVDERNELPDEFSLSVFPNPSNPTTNVHVEVSHSGDYELILFNLLGQQVLTVHTGRIDHFLTTELSLASAPNGMYFLALISNDQPLAIHKLLLLK
jgi:hypothetical protein